MRYVEFGKTGEKVSEMCLGTMMFGLRCDQAESDRILGAALEYGVNFIDTAPMYGNGLTEEILGQIMVGRRDQLFVATKVHKGVDADSILTSIDESLARLRLDYVDLYMIHWPVEGMRVEEIMAALNRVVAQGKARYVGCCNYPAWLVAYSNGVAERNGWPQLVCNQIAYNPIERGVEIEILPQALAQNIAITVYRPLVAGLLAGKYKSGQPLPADSRVQTDTRLLTWLAQYGDQVDQFNRLAQTRGLHPAQLAIAWARFSPAVTNPIVGASSLRQLETTVAAFEFELSADEHEAITQLFGAEVWEEGLQRFPGLRYNFPRLRRNLNLAR